MESLSLSYEKNSTGIADWAIWIIFTSVRLSILQKTEMKLQIWINGFWIFYGLNQIEISVNRWMDR